MTVPPIISVFMAMGGYAILPDLLKGTQLDVPSLPLIGLSMFFLSIFAMASSLYFEKDFSILKMNGKIFSGLLLFSFLNFLSFAIFLLAKAKIPVVQYQRIALLAPLISGLFASWLLKQEFKPQYLIGLCLIAVGPFLALRKSVE